mmetsp:Transcript_96616/g.207299  ORF Transcript_96616/g.207299 Transcript_96616/m.207299 type:complete len:223 (+) Transcript_96616:1411-2079(+)
MKLVVAHPDINLFAPELLPDLVLGLINFYGRQRKLQVRPHVAVDEDLMPAGHSEGGDRWGSHLMIEALYGARRVQQLLLPLDRRPLIDPDPPLQVHHDQPMVPLCMQVGEAHEGREAAHASHRVVPRIEPGALLDGLGFLAASRLLVRSSRAAGRCGGGHDATAQRAPPGPAKASAACPTRPAPPLAPTESRQRRGWGPSAPQRRTSHAPRTGRWRLGPWGP